MKAVVMANDLFSSLRTYLNKVSEGERTPAELGNALNTWVRQSGDALKSKIDEEVNSTVSRMGFIKREEFDELRAELDALKKTMLKKASVKKNATTSKPTSAKKKSAPSKKGK
jgi:BMFP domain-containing protein YqiC